MKTKEIDSIEHKGLNINEWDSINNNIIYLNVIYTIFLLYNYNFNKSSDTDGLN